MILGWATDTHDGRGVSMRGPGAALSLRGTVARLTCLALAGAVVAGCAPTVPRVTLPKKGAVIAPVLGAVAPRWTHAQIRVKRAYHAAQVALERASATQDAGQARVMLAPYVLPADVARFIALMAANWRLGEISGGSMRYRVENITIKGSTALIETCWPTGSFDLRSAATGKPVAPQPTRARHSLPLMGLLNGRWLQGRSILDPTPCA